jgi:tryptophanyl-tRNA synthetase
MAADILLYDAVAVPVGDDQKQHIELTRDLAGRFNSRFGPTFTLPDALIPAESARIYDLQTPTSKMSKSAASDAGVVWLLDPPTTTAKKIRSAVTDTGREVRFDREAQPGVSNLVTMLSVFAGEPVGDVVARFEGRGYGDLKREVADAVVAEFGPVRQRALELLADPAELDRLLAHGAERAEAISAPKLATVYERMGLLPRA